MGAHSAAAWLYCCPSENHRPTTWMKDAELTGSSCTFQPTCGVARGTEAELGAGAPQRAALVWACWARLSLQSWGKGAQTATSAGAPGPGLSDPAPPPGHPEMLVLQGRDPSPNRGPAWRLECSELLSPPSLGPGKVRQDLQGALQGGVGKAPALSGPRTQSPAPPWTDSFSPSDSSGLYPQAPPTKGDGCSWARGASPRDRMGLCRNFSRLVMGALDSAQAFETGSVLGKTDPGHCQKGSLLASLL